MRNKKPNSLSQIYCSSSQLIFGYKKIILSMLVKYYILGFSFRIVIGNFKLKPYLLHFGLVEF